MYVMLHGHRMHWMHICERADRTMPLGYTPRSESELSNLRLSMLCPYTLSLTTAQQRFPVPTSHAHLSCSLIRAPHLTFEFGGFSCTSSECESQPLPHGHSSTLPNTIVSMWHVHAGSGRRWAPPNPTLPIVHRF